MNARITRPGGRPDVTVRRAVARDARRLTRIVQGSRAYEGHYAAMVAGYRVTSGYIEAHRVFAAVDRADDRVLGFYALLVDAAELDLMFVADDAQGLGIGRLLVDHMRGEARAAGLDRVRVVAHPPAEGFYRGMGALRTGTAPAQPPAVGWERPELEFAVPDGA
ncbi:GNAT family N-acetyltransferase [Streptomyces xanthii]|uniref:GNAT family N-acetyltransferase n=1 Tax=Streptomyces xanthii TaxID=2768069 RepID=A0A7H1BGC6_9ACTN|nr:GNAT family N-acetyltransferase [Streptomyces xanthii]QNS07781.1 GNAT family N-acetyltransferase [Streptomyces xanthii]